MEKNLLKLRGVMVMLLMVVGMCQAIAYSISISQTHCTISNLAATENVNEGASLSFIVTPAEGYTVTSVTATDASGNSVEVSNNGSNYSFTMPANDVTISAEALYTITGTQTNCTLTDLPASADKGTSVTFTATPAVGYYLASPTIKDASNNNVAYTKVGVNQYSFTMPVGNVTVDAAGTTLPCTISNGTLGTDYYIDGSDIWVIGNATNGKGVNISGRIPGYIVIQNTRNGRYGDKIVNLTNIETGDARTQEGWNSSLLITNTGILYEHNYPTITVNFTGTNSIVNRNAPGLLINPKGLQTASYQQKECDILINTSGESDFYVGTNYSKPSTAEATDLDYFAVYDGGKDDSNIGESIIKFDSNVLYDNIGYSTSIVSSGNTPVFQPVTKTTGDDYQKDQALNTFIASAKTTYKYIKFTLNQKTDTRSGTTYWATICYPYSGEATNAKIYKIFGRIMYKDGDALPSTNLHVGDLKNIVLLAQKGDSTNLFNAGTSYFARRLVSGDMTFTMTGDTYTAPDTLDLGLTGTYQKVRMGTNSIFMSGGSILEVGSKVNNCGAYRAYWPYDSETKNFRCSVPEVYFKDGEYYVYKRTGGEGSQTEEDSSSNSKKINISDYLILGEEETATFINTYLRDNGSFSSKYYDMQGREVLTPQKGSLYILNGKKVIY